MLNKNSIFLIDSNVLIDAKNLHYQPGFCMNFWDWLKTGYHAKILFSIDIVRKEILNGNDNDYLVTNLAKSKDYSNFFLTTQDNQRILNKYAEIQNWANDVWAKEKGGKTVQIKKALEDFAKEDNADPWLVAYAATQHNAHIVTHETSKQLSLKNIKIPDVAKAFGVKTHTVYKLLENRAKNNFTFVLPEDKC